MGSRPPDYSAIRNEVLPIRNRVHWVCEHLEENNPTTTATPYMTVAEAAEYLRWSTERIYKLTAARAIPHHKHAGRLLFRRDALDAWLDEYAEGPRARDTAAGRRHAPRGG